MRLQVVAESPGLLPTRAHDSDAGLDLRANIKGELVLLPGERALVPTGIRVDIPKGYAGFIHPRSGMAHRDGITVNNAPGTIDAGYTGEIMVNLINHGEYPVTIKLGDRIAQLIIQAVELPKIVIVDSLDTTTRGANGHGSTGA